MSNKEAIGLTKDDSLVIKGVAILAMMWNHCFLPDRFEKFDLTFVPFGVHRVTQIAVFLKICVSLFAFVSGYGLYYSLRSLEKKGGGLSSQGVSTWYKTRYVKSFSDYWLIVVLAWIICQLLDGHTYKTYFANSLLGGISSMLMQLLGVSAFFEAPMLIATWWYMSAALIFILLAPLAYLLMRRFGGIFCFGAVLVVARVAGGYPGGTNWLSFLPAFVIGMACADSDIMRRIRAFADSSPARSAAVIVSLLLATLLCYKLRQALHIKLYWDLHWGLFMPIYIALIMLTVARIPGVKDVLHFLGSWSADVFLIHSFFRAHYAIEFVYAPGNFMLVMARLLALGLIATALFRVFKRLIRYESFVDALLARCTE